MAARELFEEAAPQGVMLSRGQVLYLCLPGFYTEVFALCFSARGGYRCTWVWPGGVPYPLQGSVLQPLAGELWLLPMLGSQDRGSGGEGPLSPLLGDALEGMPQPSRGCVPVGAPSDGQGGMGTVRDADRRGCDVVLLLPLRSALVVLPGAGLRAALLSQPLSASCSSLSTILR